MAVLSKDIIIQTLVNNHQKLSEYGVKQIGLFGSYVHERANEKSDIDLLVDIIKEKKTFRNFMDLNYYLEELFAKKVELVTLQSLSPYIGPHILKDAAYVTFVS